MLNYKFAVLLFILEKTSVVLGLFIGCPGVITIYFGKLEILVEKSNGLRHFVWEASENMGAVFCDDVIFFYSF